MLKRSFKQFGYFHSNISIDESMIEYYGKHPAKQFIKGKSVRFGFKNWMMASSTGYCYDFEIYCGKNETEKRTIPLGAKIIVDFVKQIPDPRHYNIFFDNYFTTHALMGLLKKMNFCATGTVRENRIHGCPIESNKTFKNKPRGSYDYR